MTEQLAIHPVADRFPMLPEPELKALAEDIKRNGLREPIKVYNGQIIDGRNRYRACELAGIEPTLEEVEFENAQQLAEYIISQNVMRRHLLQSQRAYMGVQMLSWGRVAKSDERIHMPKKADVAKLLGISTANLGWAETVRTQGDDNLKEQVLSGAIRVDEAVEEINRQLRAESKAKAKTRAKELTAEHDELKEKFVNGEIKYTTFEKKSEAFADAFNTYVNKLPKLTDEDKITIVSRLDLGQPEAEENDVAPTVEEETAKDLGMEHMKALSRAMREFNKVILSPDEVEACANLKSLQTFTDDLREHAANVGELLALLA